MRGRYVASRLRIKMRVTTEISNVGAYTGLDPVALAARLVRIDYRLGK
jgi:hypothetical protein